MSQENVERLHRAFDAFARRDKAAWLELCDPDLELAPIGNWPETPPIHGAEAAWDFLLVGDHRAEALEAAGLSE